MKMNKWHMRMLRLAEEVSTWSKDPSTKVGAVIIDENRRVVSIGYNGFPRGVKDDARLEDRVQKYQIIVHAEMNAILFSTKNLDGCTLYTYPFIPCPTCASVVVQKGISQVVSLASDNPRWQEQFDVSRMIFKETYVDCIEYSQELWEN